jgi:isocitrate dehydrogenase
VGQLDNRGSQFYLAMYWAQALAQQDDDLDIKNKFKPIAAALAESENKILQELLSVQGHPADIGGYYHPDISKLVKIMRPSPTFNQIIDSI